LHDRLVHPPCVDEAPEAVVPFQASGDDAASAGALDAPAARGAHHGLPTPHAGVPRIVTRTPGPRVPVGAMPGSSQSMRIAWVTRLINASTTQPCLMVRETGTGSMAGGTCDTIWFASKSHPSSRPRFRSHAGIR
jgi:hypothetical protein